MDLSIIIAHYDPGNHPRCIDFFHRTLDSIIEQKKSENEILLIYEEIANDLKKIGVNKKIHILEKKLIHDMNEETYKELLNLKKQANNG